MEAKQGDVAGVSSDQLRSIVERIERLEEEKKAISEDIREVYVEAKGNGFDPKILRKLIAIRKRDRAELDEEETILEIYMRALGMLADTPLGQHAIKSAVAKPDDTRITIATGNTTVETTGDILSEAARQMRGKKAA